MLGQAYLYWPLYRFTFQGIGIKYFTTENLHFYRTFGRFFFLFFSYVGVCVFIRVCGHKCREGTAEVGDDISPEAEVTYGCELPHMGDWNWKASVLNLRRLSSTSQKHLYILYSPFWL